MERMIQNCATFKHEMEQKMISGMPTYSFVPVTFQLSKIEV